MEGGRGSVRVSQKKRIEDGKKRQARRVWIKKRSEKNKNRQDRQKCAANVQVEVSLATRRWLRPPHPPPTACVCACYTRAPLFLYHFIFTHDAPGLSQVGGRRGLKPVDGS
ncbi:hypothetical protein LSTR_LSTR016013 [Laodelphax striatellus]|uniref:Uncharacterized protein n=1 Tax=Laodelphax striatellus TaxID=195883 RepID=A0A482XIR7_LAOST|nr:hypothetical protein LSTR_LSTR016013 [Laodelphax striatellus]